MNEAMTNKEKLEELKEFLRENEIPFEENHVSQLNVVMDLQIKDFMVAVHVSDGHDQEFYEKTYKYYNPFFIRDNESADFVVNKMQLCLTKIMMRRQARYMKNELKEANRRMEAENMKRAAEKKAAKASRSAAIEKPKRKRQRIVRYEKVSKR